MRSDKNPSVQSIFRFFMEEIYAEYKSKPIGQKLPDILQYLRLWSAMARYLRIIHVSLGISATFFSALAATQIGSIDNNIAKIFAFIATVSIALMTAFNLGVKSNNTRAAWRHLNAEVMKFNQGLCKEQDVIKAYEEAEGLIGDVSYQGMSVDGRSS
jgi:hypothetical protein